MSDGPHRPGACQGRKFTIDDMYKLHEGDAGVLAIRHRGGAGVVLLTFKYKPKRTDTYDGGDHPQKISLGLKMGPLKIFWGWSPPS